MPILKTTAGGLLVQLGFSFLATFSMAVTYLYLNTICVHVIYLDHERNNSNVLIPDAQIRYV